MPHYHVLLRQGYDVWTYDTQRHVRLRTERLFAKGWRSIILVCTKSCRIYLTGIETVQDLKDRLDQLR